MRKLKTLGVVASVLATAALISSCNTESENEFTTGQTIAKMTSVVQNIDNPGDVTFCDLSFGIVYDYNAATTTVQLLGLKLPDNGQLPKLTFSDMPWSVKDGWKETQVNDITPKVDGFSNLPLFNTFKMRLKDIYLSSVVYTPGFFYNFIIDGKTQVFGPVYKGKTVTTTPKGEEVKNDETKYFIDINESASTATIEVYDAQFVSGMPKLNLAFDAIPYTMEGEKFVFSVAKLTPSFGGTPFPRFPISNLKATLDFSEGFDLEFTCTYKGEDYKVVADTDRSEVKTDTDTDN